ncbi:hypothetical protein MNBD_GAMMA01-235 [hydrothermal vent metagenome]|uniref:HTH LytTR-type domain-containing protein n=1 Tax=hydrothermal vent metagenome TaxID=652676 RepID=A0A3B0UPY6_9ZZZZ
MKLNTSFKHNSIVAFAVSLWVFSFLFFTRPFKQYSLLLPHLFIIALGMSVIVLMTYYLTVLVQNKIYSINQEWSLTHEILLLMFFCLVLLITSFYYYKSDFSRGSYDFFKYFYTDFLPSLSIILPFLILSRRYIAKYSDIVTNPMEQKIITINGKNKLDFLKIKKNNLISVSSAQNYCEIHFIRDNQLENKLIRIPLKRILIQCPFLIKVHRSHLINPEKFIGFKDSKTLSLTHIDIPISHSYKKIIEKL